MLRTSSLERKIGDDAAFLRVVLEKISMDADIHVVVG